MLFVTCTMVGQGQLFIWMSNHQIYFWMSPGLPKFWFCGFNCTWRRLYQGSSIERTVGYVDPEYQETLQVTEKCDVYSFGVVLVEVLTSQYPLEMFLVRQSYLIQNFVLSMAENRILQIVDDRVLSEGSSEDIQAFSELALRCVKNKGDERPTMREVTLELSRIQHLIRSKQNNGSGSAQTQLV
jgi:serine/threonine protein kinase